MIRAKLNQEVERVVDVYRIPLVLISSQIFTVEGVDVFVYLFFVGSSVALTLK